MNQAVLNELWFRIIETGTKGIAFTGLALWFLRLATSRGVGLRVLLACDSVASLLLGIGSGATSYAIYTNHPITIAWVQGPSAISALFLLGSAIGYFPQTRFLLRMWGQMPKHATAPDALDDLKVHSVRLRPLKGVLQRLRHKEADRGPAAS